MWTSPQKHFPSLFLVAHLPTEFWNQPQGHSLCFPWGFCYTPMEDTAYVFAPYPLYKNLCWISPWITSLYLWTNILSPHKDNYTIHHHSFLQWWNLELCVELNSHNDVIPGSWYHYAYPFSNTVSKIWLLLFLYVISWFWKTLDPRIFEPLRRDQLKLDLVWYISAWVSNWYPMLHTLTWF